MARSKKVKTSQSPSTEPIALAEILPHSPVAQLLKAREEKAQVEPEHPLPDPGAEAAAAFQRLRERDQAMSHVEQLGRPSMEAIATEALVECQKPTHVERLKGLRPALYGFRGLEGHYAAGIRPSRSMDKQTVAIQFADDHRPSADGLNPEKQRLQDRGFSYKPERAQWERRDREQPADNYQDAKAFVEALVKDRSAEVGRG